VTTEAVEVLAPAELLASTGAAEAIEEADAGEVQEGVPNKADDSDAGEEVAEDDDGVVLVVAEGEDDETEDEFVAGEEELNGRPAEAEDRDEDEADEA
jgi:hypothetical protein